MKIYLILLIFLLISCADNKNRENTIIFGVEDVYPPYSYVENGELKGFNIDLGNEIAIILNKKVKFHLIEWDDMIQTLNSNKVDAIASVTKTDSRKKRVDFSKPYYFENVTAVYKNNLKFINKQELKNKRIACVLGTVSQIYLEENLKKTKLSIVSLNSVLLELLKANHTDVIVLEEYVAKKFVNSNKNLELRNKHIKKK